jgi:hypothetical protein
MRTSLNEICRNEKYLEGGLSTEDRLLFEARILTNPLLKMNLFFQQKTLALVRMYHRKKLKEEAEQAHQRLFSDPAKAAFRHSVLQFFKK